MRVLGVPFFLAEVFWNQHACLFSSRSWVGGCAVSWLTCLIDMLIAQSRGHGPCSLHSSSQQLLAHDPRYVEPFRRDIESHPDVQVYIVSKVFCSGEAVQSRKSTVNQVQAGFAPLRALLWVFLNTTLPGPLISLALRVPVFSLAKTPQFSFSLRLYRRLKGPSVAAAIPSP